MRKLSLKSNLGIAIAIGAAAVIAIVVALLLRFHPIGYLDFDAMALTDSEIANNLKSENLEDEKKVIDPARLPVFAPLFERMGAIFGGDDKVQLNSNFPVYTDDGAVLMMLGDDAWLITEDLERVSTYRNLYVSDGVSFNQDRERADVDQYSLLSVSGGVYINLNRSEVGGKIIPMNSAMYFTEDHIAFYKPQDHQFLYDRIDGLNGDSTIKIGSKVYNYYDLLRKLGLMASNIASPDEGGAGEEGFEEPEEVPEVVAKPADPRAPKPPQPGAATESPRRVSIHLSPAQCFIGNGKVAGYMTTRLSVQDRSGLVTSDVTVYLYQGDKLIATYTLPKAEFEGKGEERVFRDIRVNQLKKGVEYTLYGTYNYNDGGTERTVVFDKQTFIFERPQTDVIETPLPPGYVRPDVELGPYSSDVYFINGHQTVSDPAGRIKGGVQYEIYRLNESAGKVYMRKAIADTRDTHLGLLPPGEPYLIRAYYTYLNESDQMMRVDLGEVTINTLPFPTDAKIKLGYATGNIFSNKIQFKDVSVDQTVSDARLLEAATRIGLFAKGKATDPGQDYMVGTSDAKAIRNGAPTLFNTTSTLTSRTTYAYEWRIYDPFGNQIPLLTPYSGTTRTSSEAPYANILVAPTAGNTAFTIRVINPDNVNIANGRIAFYEIVDGIESQTPVLTQRIVNGGYGASVPGYSISPSGTEWNYNINIANFKLDRAYVIKITGDYDLEDGPDNSPNLRTNQIIATKQFTATTVKSLGSVAFNTTVRSVTGHEADILENVNRYATQQITMDLLSRVTFEIYRAEDLAAGADTALPVRSVTVSKLTDAAAFADLLDPNTRFENLLTDLDSKQEYKIRIIPEILILDEYYVLPAINDNDTFFTKKQTPKAVIANGDLLAFTDAIYIFNARIDDPDEAILGGNVSMLVVNGSLVPVYTATMDPNRDYDFMIPGLDTGDTYTITFTAPVYNDAFDERDYTSYQTNVRIETLPTGTGADESQFSQKERPASPYNDCYRVKTEDGISGRLTLRGMDVIKDESGKVIPGSLNTKLRAEINDTAQYLKSDPTYTLRFYRNLGYGDYTKSDEFAYPYTWTENLVDDQVIELPVKYYYRAELWINVGGRNIMIDQVFFDTQGPMTPIFVTDQLRWLSGADARSGEDLMTKPLTGEWLATASLDVLTNTVPDGFGDGPVLTAADTGGRYGRYLVIEDLYHFYNTIPGNTALGIGSDNGLAQEAGYDLAAIKGILDKAPSGQTRLAYIRGTSTPNPGNGASNSGNGPFNGVIDFQGHTIIYNVDTDAQSPAITNRQLFYHIGYSGVMKNLTLEYGIRGENPGETTNITPVYTNRGRIENIRIKSMKDNGRYNYAYSLLCYSNAISGVIENFTVDLGEGVTSRQGFGGVVYSNNGIVRNGYVYGSESGEKLAPGTETTADAMTRDPSRKVSRHGRITVPIVPAAENTAFAVANLGGAVASNTATGRVSNVYSLADIYVNVFGTGADRTYQPQSLGSVVGTNSGRVDSVYSLGEPYFNTATVQTYKAGINPTTATNDYVYGPGIGGVGASARTANSYYVTADPLRLYKGAWGVKTSFDTLHDYLWQQRITGASFEAIKTVAAGYFPQLVQPYGMPAQPYLPLPEISAVENVEISSVFVEKQMEDYAIALVTLKNKGYYYIRSFAVGSLTATVIPGSQIDSDGVSRVQVRLEKPKEFKSSYTITGFAYSLLNSSYVYEVPANFAVAAEFYKIIHTPQEWMEINDIKNWNYRLGNDLDLTGVAPAKLMIGAYSTTQNANVFTGAIDGGYYDDNYKLQGVYKITGIDLSTTTVTSGVGVIPTLWGGTVSNLLIEGMRIDNPNVAYAGFIVQTNAGARIDNVHIKDSTVRGYSYSAVLADAIDYTDVTNCSVNNSKVLDTAKSIGAGTYMAGLIGAVNNGSTVFNSYVYGIDIQNNFSDQNRGVGGLVGRFNSGEIANVYAQGRIKVNSTDINIGGLIGYRDSNDRILENSWTDVAVSTEGRNAGGLIGGAGTMTEFAELDSLVLGDVDTSLGYVPYDDARPVRRIVGTTGGNEEAITIKGPVAGSFAYDGQLITTKPYDPWLIMGADGNPQGPGRDGATMASADDLKSEDYYLGTIHMDDGFIYDGTEFADTYPQYTGVENGNLPWLRNTDGGMLPYQTARKPGEHEYSINVISAVYDGAALKWEVVMQVTHPAGADIKSLVIDNIQINDSDIAAAYEITKQSAAPTNIMTTIVLTLKREHLLKFVDTYAITGVVVTNPNGPTPPTITEQAASRILFDALSVPYLLIGNVAEWCEQMTADKHGQSTENIRITGDLDFASNTVTADQIKDTINVRVNRLVGQPGKTAIKNLNLSFGSTGMGFVKYANALLQDLSFQNVSITQTAQGGVRTGIIAECSGTVQRVDFTNIDLKTNGASYAGSIGYMSGIVNDVKLTNIHVDGTRTDTQTIYTYSGSPYGSAGKVVSQQAAANGGQGNYIGGLIGYALDSTITNVRLTYDAGLYNAPNDGTPSVFGTAPLAQGSDGKPLGEYDLTLAGNPNVVWGRYMVGGIAGALYTTRISDCSVEYTSAYGEIWNVTNNLAGTQATSDCYVGSLVGYTTISGTEPRNERLHASHVRVITEGQRAGGMFGHGLCYGDPHEPTSVSHAVVIAAGAYAGGFTGVWYSTSAHIDISNVKVFARQYAGGFTGATSSTTYAVSVRDSVVGSIFDDGASSSVPSFWEPQYKGAYIYQSGNNYPDTVRMSRNFVTYPTYNKYYGGFAGAGRAYSVTVVNSLIGAEGADYVGGMIGTGDTSAHNFDEVLDSSIYGRNYVGGIVGYMPKYSIGYCASNADIVGTGNYVGGLAGYIKPDQALDGTNAAYERNNIVAGSVQGANYVGGLIGHVEGNLYPIQDKLVYYYANPHANATATNAANNTSIATAQLSINRDRDSIMVGKVKVTGTGTLYGSLLYNLDEKLPAASLVQPMGHRIWEYSVLDVGGAPTYARDLRNGAQPVYKYGSLDGEYLAATLDGRDDGRGFREEPLYSTENLLLTREHLLGTYNTVGMNFAYGNATVNGGAAPETDSATGLVKNWSPATSFMKSDYTIMGSPGSTAGGAGNNTTGAGGAGGIAYMRQVYRINYGTGQNEPSYWWYGGFRYGYLPYTTAQIIYYYQPNTTTSPRSQAPFTEGSDASGNYYDVAHSPFLTDNSFGTWTDFSAAGRTPGSKYYYYNPTAAHTYTGAWTSKHYSDANVDQTYGGGIRIPANPSGVAVFGLSMEDEAPGATVYAVSADKISIDFSAYVGGAFSLVDAGGREIYGGLIEEPTYTFTYDFKKKLTLVTGMGGATETFEIEPADLLRTISVYGSDWYHLSGGGVYAGSHAGDALISGSFLNLIGGEALSADGDVYDVSTGQVVRKLSDAIGVESDTENTDGQSVSTGEAKPPAGSVRLLKDPVPLYTFDYNGTTIKTFATYSVLGTGEKQPLRLYVKNGHLAAIDPQMPIAADALILDYKTNGVDPATAPEIMTVLGKDGVLADIKEPIKIPADFRTDFVREMSNTLSSDQTVAMVRYKSGRVAAFDYLTGEEIPLDADKGEGSLFAYAKSVLSDNASSMFATLSGSYVSLRAVESQIRSGTIPDDGTGTADAGGKTANSGEAIGGSDTDGSDAMIAGETIGTTTDQNDDLGIGAGSGEAGDATGGIGLGAGEDDTTGVGPAEEVIEGLGGNAGTDMVTGAGAGAPVEAKPIPPAETSVPGESTAPNTAAPDKSADAGTAASDEKPGAGEPADPGGGDGAPDGEEATTGDLSRPSKGLSLVSVYNMAEGKYQVYDAGSLTSVSDAAPITTVDLKEIDAAYMFESMRAFGNSQSDRGLLLLILIAGAVALLLVYVGVKRKRLTK
ncbi:hypothetical protein AGMMS49983_16240 [Clostridia bacterium]|nr:hypothetical protein AGMMS49983_16240 [Clostridia bacterium]